MAATRAGRGWAAVRCCIRFQCFPFSVPSSFSAHHTQCSSFSALLFQCSHSVPSSFSALRFQCPPLSVPTTPSAPLSVPSFSALILTTRFEDDECTRGWSATGLDTRIPPPTRCFRQEHSTAERVQPLSNPPHTPSLWCRGRGRRRAPRRRRRPTTRGLQRRPGRCHTAVCTAKEMMHDA